MLEVKNQQRVIWIILFALLLHGCTTIGSRTSARHQPSPSPMSPSESTSTDAALIKPGRSVGPLRIGDSRERALELFGKPIAGYDYDYGVSSSAPHEVIDSNPLGSTALTGSLPT